MLITEEYKRLNKELHELRDDYGASGHKWARPIVDLARNLETRDVLDYGCGKGSLRKSLPLLDVKNYDPAVEEWSSRPEPADIVVCCDVLEHVEPECLDEVIKDLGALAKIGLLLVVATRPAVKVLSDGRNAHLIQESWLWWINRLNLIEFDIQQLNNVENQEFIAIYKNPKYELTREKSINV